MPLKYWPFIFRPQSINGSVRCAFAAGFFSGRCNFLSLYIDIALLPLTSWHILVGVLSHVSRVFVIFSHAVDKPHQAINRHSTDYRNLNTFSKIARLPVILNNELFIGRYYLEWPTESYHTWRHYKAQYFMMRYQPLQLISPWTKWPPFRRRYL